MRILMMGTGPFAVPTFRALLGSRHEMVALITRPVPPATGRNRAAAVTNPMRDLAEQRGVTIHAPETINAPDSLELLRRCAADLFVVCDYGQILSHDALRQARLGGINLHASLLPKYRGAAPINWALFHGESRTGVTVIHMTPRLDGGPCLIQTATPISPTIDAVELERELAELGVAAVEQAVAKLESWDGESGLGMAQNNTIASRAPRLKKSDGWVDWRRSAPQIVNQVRGFKPWPGTFTEWTRDKGPLRLLLDQVHPLDTEPTSVAPGMIVAAESERLVVACGRGTLAIDRLQPAGKNVLSAAEFLRGYSIHVGEQLGGGA